MEEVWVNTKLCSNPLLWEEKLSRAALQVPALLNLKDQHK